MINAKKNSSTIGFSARQALLGIKAALTDMKISWAKSRKPRQGGANVLDAMRQEQARSRSVEDLLALREDLHAAMEVGRKARSSFFFEL